MYGMSSLILRVSGRRKLLESCLRSVRPSFRNESRRPQVGDEEEPVKFSTSKAAVWSARYARGDLRDDSPWFQPLAVFSSIAIFMLYFCVYREENDIDIELSKTLYDRIPGLERKQLEIVLEYNESQGLDTTAIRNRIDELDEAAE